MESDGGRCFLMRRLFTGMDVNHRRGYVQRLANGRHSSTRDEFDRRRVSPNAGQGESQRGASEFDAGSGELNSGGFAAYAQT